MRYLTCSFGGELERLAVLVVSVAVLAGDARVVDGGRLEAGEDDVAGVELAVQVDAGHLALLPNGAVLSLVLDPKRRGIFP